MDSLDAARGLLGVDRDAEADDIRRAWRRQARHVHPDAGGDAAHFQQLQAAVDLLLADHSRRAQHVASPSTGRRAYPSTTNPGGGGPVVDDHSLDLHLLDGPPPRPGQGWHLPGLARAVADHLRGQRDVPLVGVSRKPGSRLNRLARHLSDDLLSTWRIEPASRRGIAGHDLEAIAHFPAAGRRRIDRASTPPEWSTTRRPSSSVAVRVIHPGTSRAATAVLAAMAIDDFCRAITWPLDDWRIPG